MRYLVPLFILGASRSDHPRAPGATFAHAIRSAIADLVRKVRPKRQEIGEGESLFPVTELSVFTQWAVT